GPETGATIGPDTAPAPAPATMTATASELAADCAARLSTPVQAHCQSSWRTSPALPLPLSRSLLPAFASRGPFTLVPTCGAIGATTGPETATAPAPEPPRLPAKADADELDWAPSLSSHVNELFASSWSTGPLPAF